MKLQSLAGCCLAIVISVCGPSARGQSAAAAPASADETTAPDYSSFADVTVYGSLARTRSSSQLAIPQFILTQAMDESAQRELTEDLQVMDRLLSKAIRGQTYQAGPYTRVLGLLVTDRDDSHSRIQFIDGVGAVFRYRVAVSMAPAKSGDSEERKSEKENSDWDAMRRELFETPSVYAPNLRLRKNAAPEYNEQVVDTMKRRVVDALQNIGRIRHLGGASIVDGADAGPDPKVIVFVECEQDGTAVTFSTSVGAIDQAGAEAVRSLQYRQSARGASQMGAYSNFLNYTSPGGASLFGTPGAPSAPGPLPSGPPAAAPAGELPAPQPGGSQFRPDGPTPDSARSLR